VDFPGVFAVLRKRHFKGWAVLDIDAPRPGDGSGTVDDNIATSVRYMRDVLKVNLPAPPAKGLFTEA
jgi:sugar phosphate isomerase/epimerase